MDPLSIAASCIGLLASVTNLSLKISFFVRDVRDARSDMEAVLRELSSLQLCLEMLRDDSVIASERLPLSFKENIISVLHNCDGVISEMLELLEKMSSRSLGRQIQWAVSGRQDMNKLRLSLEAYKASIDIALSMVTIVMTMSIQEDTLHIRNETNRIRGDTAYIPQMQQDVSQIPLLIEEITRLRERLETRGEPDMRENLLIQRFLDETASLADETSAESIIDLAADPLTPDATLLAATDIPAMRTPGNVDYDAIKASSDARQLLSQSEKDELDKEFNFQMGQTRADAPLSMEIVRLVDQGASLEASGNGNRKIYPLWRALQKPDINLLRFFLERGADPNATLVRRSPRSSVLEAIYVNTPLAWAIEMRLREYVNLLLDWGASVNPPNKNNCVSPLGAALRANPAAVQTLLDCGHSLDLRAVRGGESMQDALRHAVAKGKYEMCEFLLERGVDPNDRKWYEVSLLGTLELVDHISEERKKQLYELLLRYGTKKTGGFGAALFGH